MDKKDIKNKLKLFLSKRHWNKKINEISKNINSDYLNRNTKESIKEYWSTYEYLHNLKWHNIYALIHSNIADESYPIVKFIPEDIFYMKVEPSLNNTNLAKAYEDKNIYHKIFEKGIMPTTILRNMHGIYYDQSYNRVYSKKVEDIFSHENKSYIVKPSLDTQKGKNVKKIDIINEKLFINEEPYETIDVLDRMYGQDFLVQENLNQHHKLSFVYAYSLNTIRIVTLRLNNNIYCISSIVRFGNEKRIVDNRGVACGVNSTGHLNDYATDLKLNIYHSHPFNNIPFSGIQIPNYESLKTFVKSLHEKLFYFDMVSWDIAIDENGEFKMIEFNLKGQEINFHQVNNGPLFGELTEDVLNQVYNK